MIERIQDGGKAFLQIEEVDDESRVRIDRSIELNLDTVGMAVQPATAMRGRYAREKVCRLEFERLRYLHPLN